MVVRWAGGRCASPLFSLSASACRATWRTTTRSRCAPTWRPGWPAIFSRWTWRHARGVRVRALGAAGRWCSASSRTACGGAAGAQAGGLLGRRRRRPRWSTTSARCSRPTRATSRRKTCRVLAGPQGQAPLVLAGTSAVAAVRRDGWTWLEQLQLSGQGSWRCPARQRRGDGTRARHAGGNGGAHARFIATLTQVSSRYGRDLESADLRYGNGYAIRLRGVTTGSPADKDDGKKKR
jgi:hypothetical protein